MLFLLRGIKQELYSFDNAKKNRILLHILHLLKELLSMTPQNIQDDYYSSISQGNDSKNPSPKKTVVVKKKLKIKAKTEEKPEEQKTSSEHKDTAQEKEKVSQEFVSPISF